MFKKAVFFAFRPFYDAFRRTRSVASLSVVAAGAAGAKVAHVARGGLVEAVNAAPTGVPPAPAHVLARLKSIARVAQIAAAIAIGFTAYWLAFGDGNFIENVNFVVFSAFAAGIAALTAYMCAVARGGEKRSFLRFLARPGVILTAPWR